MKHLRRIALSLLVLASLAVGLMPALAFADDTPDPITKSGTYHFTSNEGSTIILEDSYDYRESCAVLRQRLQQRRRT